jgi:hypothetical protein
MATVRKRGTSRPFRWEAQFRMRGWPTQTKTSPTKADAEQWASELEAEMRHGTSWAWGQARRYGRLLGNRSTSRT